MRKLAAVAVMGFLVLPAQALADSTPLAIDVQEPGARALAREPGTVFYTGDGSAYLAGTGSSASSPARIRWVTWDQGRAVGYGGDWRDNCKPDCAAGSFRDYRVSIQLYRPRHLGSHLIFTRMTVRYVSEVPKYPGTRQVTFKAEYDPRYNSYFLNQTP